MMRGAMLMGHAGPAIMIFKLLGLIGIALIVIAIILLVKHNKKAPKATVKDNEANSAVETVKMLYAKGTIDEAEYSKRLAVLSGNVYINTNSEEDTTHSN